MLVGIFEECAIQKSSNIVNNIDARISSFSSSTTTILALGVPSGCPFRESLHKRQCYKWILHRGVVVVEEEKGDLRSSMLVGIFEAL